MKANVYIDGFNLYYGALRGTAYKWLDLSAMCQRLLPGRSIGRIRYFTARITPLPHDQQAPARQQDYLRALGTIPNLNIHYGHFVSHPQNWPAYPLVYPAPGVRPLMASILRTEEKRSDVNLATLLLIDCVDDVFDEAVVISNDSDLMLPIEYAIKRFGKPSTPRKTKPGPSTKSQLVVQGNQRKRFGGQSVPCRHHRWPCPNHQASRLVATASGGAAFDTLISRTYTRLGRSNGNLGIASQTIRLCSPLK